MQNIGLFLHIFLPFSLYFEWLAKVLFFLHLILLPASRANSLCIALLLSFPLKYIPFNKSEGEL